MDSCTSRTGQGSKDAPAVTDQAATDDDGGTADADECGRIDPVGATLHEAQRERHDE